jgi:hypothetical protein
MLLPDAAGEVTYGAVHVTCRLYQTSLRGYPFAQSVLGYEAGYSSITPLSRTAPAIQSCNSRSRPSLVWEEPSALDWTAD